MKPQAILVGLAIAILAACAGGGPTGSPMPGAASNASNASRAAAQGGIAGKKHKPVKGYMRIVIARHKPRHGARRPRFVSSATQGIAIVANNGTSSVTTVASLATSSSYCATAGGTSTCTVPVSVPVGDDTISVTTYDKAPSGGTIPSNADPLGIGKTTATVAATGAPPTIAVYLGGVIATIDAGTAFQSLPATGVAASPVPLIVTAKDFGNVNIVAGTHDPYNNPITATLTETAGNGTTGHSWLTLNGDTTQLTTAKLKYSDDTLDLNYDGLGKPGYTVSIAFSASGAQTQTDVMSPLYVTGSAILNHILGLNGTPSDPTLTISEVGGTHYNVAPSGCTNIAVPSAVSGTGSTATFTVQGGTTADATHCTLVVSDASSTQNAVATTNTPIAGGVTIGGVQLTDYNVGTGTASGSITVGPDGNVWFVQLPQTVAILNPSTQTLVSSVLVPNPQPSTGAYLTGITTGSDGAVWASDDTNDGAHRIANSSGTYTVTDYPNGSSNQSFGITTASDGTMWIGAGGNHLVNLDVGGLFSVASAATSSTPTRLVQGPDSAIWFVESQKIGRWDGTTLSEAPLPSGAAYDLCVGQDGNIWFTANAGTPYLGKIVPTAPTVVAQTVATTSASATLAGIACGADDAVWYADISDNQIGRISLKSGNAQTVYTVPDTNFFPQFITVGPDGTLWYTSTGTLGDIGHIIP